MLARPAFASRQEQVSRIGDADFWWPYVAEILAQHGLTDAGVQPVAGHNATYPTFLCGEVVVKLFGNSPWWRGSHEAERAALALVAADPEILAPRLLGAVQLFEAGEATWPYLLISRVPGVASWRADLSPEQRLLLASDVGRQLRRVHALRPSAEVATDAAWPALDIAGAARRSSLPPHLVAQVDGYVARLRTTDRVLLHGDLVANHAYVDEAGRLVGIIDWGDATVTDRHYELIQVYRDLLGCDRVLFRAFLEAAEWPVGKDFPYRTMRLALYRQAVGLAQHDSMDVFQPIAAAYPLQEIATLDELADVLFGV